MSFHTSILVARTYYRNFQVHFNVLTILQTQTLNYILFVNNHRKLNAKTT